MSIYDIKVKNRNGDEVSLNTFKGKVLLEVENKSYEAKDYKVFILSSDELTTTLAGVPFNVALVTIISLTGLSILFFTFSKTKVGAVIGLSIKILIFNSNIIIGISY